MRLQSKPAALSSPSTLEPILNKNQKQIHSIRYLSKVSHNFLKCLYNFRIVKFRRFRMPPNNISIRFQAVPFELTHRAESSVVLGIHQGVVQPNEDAENLPLNQVFVQHGRFIDQMLWEAIPVKLWPCGY